MLSNSPIWDCKLKKKFKLIITKITLFIQISIKRIDACIDFERNVCIFTLFKHSIHAVCIILQYIVCIIFLMKSVQLFIHDTYNKDFYLSKYSRIICSVQTYAFYLDWRFCLSIKILHHINEAGNFIVVNVQRMIILPLS